MFSPFTSSCISLKHLENQSLKWQKRLRQSKAKSFRQLDKMKVIFLLYLMKGFRRYNNHTKCLSSCPAESSLPWYIRISPASSEMVCFEHQLSSTTSVTACFQSRNGSFRTKLPFRSLFPGRPEQGVSPQMPYGHSRSDKPRDHQLLFRIAFPQSPDESFS